jgi:hypothetical protein
MTCQAKHIPSILGCGGVVVDVGGVVGHAPKLHVFVSGEVGHACPPLAAGAETVNARVCMPAPHESEQPLHSPH